MKRLLRYRAMASFTVESAVIIPVFTFITVALIAMGFYVRNSVMVKSLCWKSAIELERITTQNPDSDVLSKAADELRGEVRSQAVFLKNINANVYKDGEGICVNVSADSSLVLPMFGGFGGISVTEKADNHNPATNMRRWHALGMLTGRGS